MGSGIRYRVNTPKITHQTVDGEVVMINFDSGCYYSLNKSGAELWELIDKALPVVTITEHLQARYPQEARVENHVADLLKQLQEEELVCAAEDSVPTGETPVVEPASQSFQKPEFQKYDDMQALLLIDPIHDVDEAGWPVADTATTPGQN